MLRACRYFGHTRDYWWANLTWALYEALEAQLAQDPPTDHLVQMYFAANKWWAPPHGAEAAGEPTEPEGDIWESDLPAVTD